MSFSAGDERVHHVGWPCSCACRLHVFLDMFEILTEKAKAKHGPVKSRLKTMIYYSQTLGSQQSFPPKSPISMYTRMNNDAFTIPLHKVIHYRKEKMVSFLIQKFNN